MTELTKNELEHTVGGGISAWGFIGIITGFVFIVGVIDGIAHPIRCSK